MNARCTICLEHNPFTYPNDNLKLRTVNGRDILVCKQHDPKRKEEYERKSGKN